MGARGTSEDDEVSVMTGATRVDVDQCGRVVGESGDDEEIRGVEGVGVVKGGLFVGGGGTDDCSGLG